MRRLVADGDAVQTGPLRALRPLAGNCERPIKVEEVGGSSRRPYLDTLLRCRKCEACLRHRRAVWMARAHHEIGMHPRTWMVTLTATPEVHFRLWCRAAQAARCKSSDLESSTPEQEFAARAAELGKEVTKWLKRTRARGAAFNYLMVMEAHKSGLPHVHLLVHEREGCTYRALTDTWGLGFAHAKLVEDGRAARYVTKYLVKSALARVRASLGYGNSTPLRPGPE